MTTFDKVQIGFVKRIVVVARSNLRLKEDNHGAESYPDAFLTRAVVKVK